MTEIDSSLSLSAIPWIALHVKPCAWLLLSHFLNCALASDASVVGKRDALALTIPLHTHTHTHTHVYISSHSDICKNGTRCWKKKSRNQGYPERRSNRSYGGTSGKKKPNYQGRRHERLERHDFGPWLRKIPCRRKLHPTPVILPEESHGQTSLWATVHGVANSQTQLKWLSTQRIRYVNK